MGQDERRQIALYGKGGIGKSTIACNLSIALTELGRKVMQVGCSPKGDSTAFLLGGDMIENDILNAARTIGIDEETIYKCILDGYKGIKCAESGGPDPGGGCAGKGVATALSYLTEYNVYHRLGRDFIVYDAIADVSCGGFGTPMRRGYAQEVYLVTSGELMSLYSANNICVAVSDIAGEGGIVRVGGLIANMRGVEKEEAVVKEVGQRLGIPVMAFVPRSSLVQEAESQGGTVLQFFPESDMAKQYRELARNILYHTQRFIPTPMPLEEIISLSRKHQAFEMVS